MSFEVLKRAESVVVAVCDELNEGKAELLECKADKNIYYVFNGTVTLNFHCDFSNAKLEYRVSLIKGVSKKNVVCHGSFNASHQPTQDNNCRIVPAKSNVTFYLTGLVENDTDIYYLHKEHMAPPPYVERFDNGTIVHVKANGLRPPPPPPPPIIQDTEQSRWPMLAAVVVLAVYSFIITIALFYTLQKGRKTRILQSEYINVAPYRQPKHHQPYTPTPRHAQVR
uniref:CD28 molecule n=1 Tax=Leptobrachium leishanense TaxID=445787 RepID=A0A8C5MN03_9ANUR